jgi:EAL domain-containing protein (putative c-di-GMP-specific phosphodiesterase class I)
MLALSVSTSAKEHLRCAFAHAAVFSEEVAMAENTDRSALYKLMASVSLADPSNDVVKRFLQAIRVHLGMDVAYVSEFVGNQSVFRKIDAPGLEGAIKAGDSQSLDDIYCRHILEGRLPQLIPDTSAEPVAMALPITQAVPVGKHMSVPIRMTDGSVYGMFCCLGFKADPSLHERDLQMMKVFADLTAFEISRDHEANKVAKEKEDRIRNVIESGQMAVVYQPIWELGNPRPVGFECLARFAEEPRRSPDKWFAEAAEAGLGTALELAAIRKALSVAASLPEDVYIAVNVSPETIVSGDLPDALKGMPTEQIVLEITEHAHIADYERLLAELHPLRKGGVRLAVDDAGAGYAGLQHILQIHPDLIKLDITLTRNINLDPARKALAAALVAFARDTDSRIIAEGVETQLELNALRSIGIEKAQGYFLGRPMPFAEAVKLRGRTKPATIRVA